MTESLRLAEYVLPGHPDKLCDRIADAIVDAAVGGDPALVYSSDSVNVRPVLEATVTNGVRPSSIGAQSQSVPPACRI